MQCQVTAMGRPRRGLTVSLLAGGGLLSVSLAEDTELIKGSSLKSAALSGRVSGQGALHKGPSAEGCEAAPPRGRSVQAAGRPPWRHTLGFVGRRVSPELRKLSLAVSFGVFFPNCDLPFWNLHLFYLAVPGVSRSTQGLR